jgi:hypothetical protein
MAIDRDVVPTVRDERGVTFALPGGPALAYQGLSATDSRGRDLPARLEVAGDVLRVRVDDAGAYYPIVVDPFFVKADLFPSDFDQSIQQCCSFGLSVAVSGDTIVVGAPNSQSLLPGLAYVFVRPASGWSGSLSETARLVPSSREAADFFGSAVAIDGATIVVGASGKDAGGDVDRGEGYVFARPAAGWSGTLEKTARLVASDGMSGDQSGASADVSGDDVVIGAPLDDRTLRVGAILDQGSAYVFEKPAGGWSGILSESAHLREASTDAESSGAHFGAAVTITGDTVAVGAPETSELRTV